MRRRVTYRQLAKYNHFCTLRKSQGPILLNFMTWNPLNEGQRGCHAVGCTNPKSTSSGLVLTAAGETAFAFSGQYLLQCAMGELIMACKDCHTTGDFAPGSYAGTPKIKIPRDHRQGYSEAG